MDVTIEKLQELYVEQGLSVRACASELGMPSHGPISVWLKKFGIKARPEGFQIGNRTPGDRLPERHGSWKGGKLAVSCTQCGKELKRFPSLINEKNFCGDACYGKWRSSNFTGSNNPNFGNDKMAADGNPNWKGGISKEPYAISWSFRLRESIRNRDDRKCRVCEKCENGTRHDVHHIDYDKKNISPDNLVTLCHSCHMKTSYNRPQWQEFFKITNPGI